MNVGKCWHNWVWHRGEESVRITEEQKKVLESFVCERLTSNELNESLMDSFVSKRGASLVKYFKKHGWEEDKSGNTAYYVIKNKQNEMLMFFSLKCGALFDPLQDEDEVKQDFQRLLILLQAIQNVKSEGAEVDEANEILTKYQVGDRISIEEFNQIIIKKAKNKKNFLSHLFGDKEKEDNHNILRVMSTYPGIELVHFCTNDNMKNKWREYHLGHTMGEVLYWKFIAPKFFKVQEIVGCKYAFLFAADLSEDGTLVNYYDVTLKFQKSLEIGTNKPFYDFCCDFMCQEINDMRKNRERFFENFNIDDENAIV